MGWGTFLTVRTQARGIHLLFIEYLLCAWHGFKGLGTQGGRGQIKVLVFAKLAFSVWVLIFC